MRNWFLQAALSALLSTSFFSKTEACTGIKLMAEDQSVIHGRTAEFGVDLELSMIFVPRNYNFSGTTPKGAGMRYQSKYAALGMIAYGAPAILDGMNEMGLSVAIFYFPGYAGYTPVTLENQSMALSPLDFSNWLLTQFANIEEVKAGLNGVVITPTILPKWGSFPPPFHYIVFDKSGMSLVIEPIDGQLVIYENRLGIMTNAPTFDWHMTNLNNFINLSPFNVSPVEIQGITFTPFGQGSGMVGLPGDFSPPSRFVRSALFCMAAAPSKNATEAVFQGFHILNQFDIPVGVVREVENGVVRTDRTLATTVRDPQGMRYYFRTYEDPTIRMAELKNYDLNSNRLERIPLMNVAPAVAAPSSAKTPLLKNKN